MSRLAQNLEKIQSQLPSHCLLLPVSKTKPITMLQEVYDLGVRVFGENKVQELAEKAEKLPDDIQWHFIGHLQSNKVKYIAPYVSLIHAVDSLKLLKEINKRASQNNRVINCLLQVHIAEEESKFGFSEEELLDFIESQDITEYNNIKIIGLMGMATNTADLDKVRSEFKSLKTLFDKIKANYKTNNIDFSELSMGMSNDYSIAIEEGSTMIRVGSLIFGSRN